MIKVKKPYSMNVAGIVRICCDYEYNNSSGELWFEIEEIYARYSSIECGDAFFVALVLLAHYQGQDIVFNMPISTRLYYGVIEILLPGLRIVNPELRAIRITAPHQDFCFEPESVGTALSLGVDSFHALATSFNSPFPVTHLTLFNSGAFGDYGGEVSRALFRRTAKRVSKAAIEMELPLITVDSNISEVLNVNFARTHSLRNLSFVLLFPQLFSKFYYASGYPATKFKLERSLADATHYDLLISKALCTESLEVLVAGLHDNRIEKIAEIASFSPSTKYLNVCVLADSNEFLNVFEENIQNCSKCHKCVKTMVAMDALGILDKYSQVFDLDIYKVNRLKNLGWILYDSQKLKSSHAVEIIQHMNNSARFLPPRTYAYAFSRGTQNLIRKVHFKKSKK